MNPLKMIPIPLPLKKIYHKIFDFFYLLKPRWGYAAWIFIILLIIILLKSGMKVYESRSLDELYPAIVETIPQVLLALCAGLAVNLFENTIMTMIRLRPSVDAYFEDVKTRLFLFGFTLNDFHKRDDLYKSVIKLFEKQKDDLKKTGKNSPVIQFRFLLLDPYTEEFENRAKFENKDKNILRIECAKSVFAINKIKEELKSIKKSLPDNGEKIFFDFKFYNIVPPHSLIITDNVVWVGPFIYQTPGTTSIWYQIKESLARNEYIEEFERLWGNEKNAYTENDVEMGNEPIDENKKRDPNKKEKYHNLMLLPKHIPKFLDMILDVYANDKTFEITDDQISDMGKIVRQLDLEKITKELEPVPHSDYFSITYPCEKGVIEVKIPRKSNTKIGATS